MKMMFFLGLVLLLAGIGAEAQQTQEACKYNLPKSLQQQGFRLGQSMDLSVGDSVTSCCALRLRKKEVASIAADPIPIYGGNVALHACYPDKDDALKNRLGYAILDSTTSTLQKVESQYFEDGCAAPSFQDSYMAYWRVAKTEDLQTTKCESGASTMFGYIQDLQKKRIVAVGTVGCFAAGSDCSVLIPPVWDGSSATFQSEGVAGKLVLKVPSPKPNP